MTNLTTRSSNRHGNLKEALVKYAIKAARSGTLEDLSLRKASRELGVSPGAAYRHFEDRDALMRAVAQSGFDLLAARFEKVLAFNSNAPTPQAARDRFFALAKEYVVFAQENYGLWRLMFGPFGLSSKEELNRPSTYDWLGKSLVELAKFDIVSRVDNSAQFFAWSAIHGLSDLHASPAISSSLNSDPIEDQCMFILEALAK